MIFSIKNKPSFSILWAKIPTILQQQRKYPLKHIAICLIDALKKCKNSNVGNSRNRLSKNI